MDPWFHVYQAYHVQWDYPPQPTFPSGPSSWDLKGHLWVWSVTTMSCWFFPHIYIYTQYIYSVYIYMYDMKLYNMLICSWIYNLTQLRSESPTLRQVDERDAKGEAESHSCQKPGGFFGQATVNTLRFLGYFFSDIVFLNSEVVKNHLVVGTVKRFCWCLLFWNDPIWLNLFI